MGRGGGAKATSTDQLLGYIHETIYKAVGQAVAKIADLMGEWTEEQITKRIVKQMYKACDPELMQMPWLKACQELVQRTMHGYSSSCNETEWFYEIDLVPAFCAAAWQLLAASGQAVQVPHEQIKQVVKMEYYAKLDSTRLDQAMWKVTSESFPEDKVRGKVFKALNGSYWSAFDVALDDGHLYEDLHGGQVGTSFELGRVETFMRRWVDDSTCRFWVALEQSGEGRLSEDSILGLFRALITPFGEEDPFSCIPAALTETIGRPPSDWPFLPEVVHELFARWSGEDWAQAPAGPPKKRRRKNAEDKPPAGKPLWGSAAEAAAAEVAKEEDDNPIRDGHPTCTSAGDCIGSPEDQLVTHLLNGVPGDKYCGPCWISFCERNSNLEGLWEEGGPAEA